MSNSEAPPAPPSTGLVGGKYQLIKMIGRGGMGSVWEARHASLGTPSAIKFIEAEYANSTEARSRFDKEAKAAATIQSKHAIQIYDHGVTDDGKPYIVMELLTGEPLDKRIDRLGTLTLQDTARILQQVCRGLSRAHERGIVHRDLKPENIFIVRNTDDDEEIAKVLDFGIAKINGTNSPTGVTSSTKTGAVLGTPFYMSPEQARGLRNVDHRTDVWSLGVIAFKCITGKLPFDGESVGDLLVKICTAPIPVPSHWVPGLPQAFDTWFSRALEREPERRFANVAELSEHLAFAAGISDPRGMRPLATGPTSGDATVATSAGGVGSGGYAHRPSALGTDPNGRSVGGMSGAPQPPQPGMGMTAAGFTSSQPVPGVGGPSKWKWVVGAALVGLLVSGIGTGIAVVVKRNQAAANTVGVGVVPAPPESALPPAATDPVVTPPPPPHASAEPPASTPAQTSPPPTPVAAVAGAKGANPSAKLAGANAGSGTKGTGGAKGTTAGAGAQPAAGAAPLPPPGAVAASPPPVSPPPTPPATTPTKKPSASKNDPGF